jgi:glycosyltransferase involved in cell wall biosynthesis
MRLIIDILDFEHGRAYGYEEYLLNLLHHIASHRHDLKVDDVILVCQTSQYDFLKHEFNEAFNYCTLKGSSYFKRFYNSYRLPSLLDVSAVDVILYTGNYMPLWGRKCKKVLVIHDLLFKHTEFCSSSPSFLLFRLQRYIYVPVSLRRADKVIAISDFTKKEIIHYYGTDSDKIVTIYNYFNFNKYDAQEDLTIKPIEKPYFLSICSGAKHKNHETMLRAFNEYCTTNKTDKFVIVGSFYPTAKQYFDSLSADVNNRIVVLSHISNADICYLYKNAKGYIAASLFEGLGMPVVEALHFNLPTYLSDTEIHREVSFNKAHYFEPTDWRSLAEMMINNCTSADVVTSVENRYSEANTSGRYISVINSLLGGVNSEPNPYVFGIAIFKWSVAA